MNDKIQNLIDNWINGNKIFVIEQAIKMKRYNLILLVFAMSEQLQDNDKKIFLKMLNNRGLK